MNDKPLRVAVVGLGRNGMQMHAASIAKVPGLTLAAGCDQDPARCAEAEKAFGCTTYTDYHEMLRAELLDLVAIVTRSNQHCPMACDCLDAGVNVLVTKPMAVNLAEARRMYDHADRAGRQLLPWLPMRWAPDFERLTALLAEGAIGKVFTIKRAASTFRRRDDWQTQRRFGGGYLLNWGPHIIEPAYLLGGSPVRSLFARMQQTINPGDTEDQFLAILTLDNGTIVQAEHATSAEPLPDWHIQGTAGTILVRNMDLMLLRRDPASSADPATPPHHERLTGVRYGDPVTIYHDVAATLREEKPFRATRQQALTLMQILDTIRTAHETNQVQHLPAPD